MAIKPKTLFETIFRSLVEARKLLAPTVDAYVMFTITGDGGGIWTFDLRKEGAHAVLVGKVENPGLHIIVESDFLDSFLAGDFEVAKAIEDNKLGIKGEQKVYKAFIQFLLGPVEGTAAKAGAGLNEPPKSAGVGLRK